MHPLRIQFAAVDAPHTPLDRAIEWLLISLVAFCPLAFGAVVAWSEGVFVLFTSAIVLCFAMKMVMRPDARFVWSWTYLPIAMFLVLIALQLVPLPVGVMRAISPNTAETKTRLLTGLPGAASAMRSMTLSLYREPTLRQLSVVAALGAIFVVVINTFQTVDSIRRLLIAITLVGLAEGLLALAQDLTQSRAIYWSIPVYEGLARSGSFVNHSHFGQFMNLSTGAASALFLLEWHARANQNDQNKGWRAGFSPHASGSIVANAPLYLSLLTILACTIALVLSLTRGGVLSMLVAGAMAIMILRIQLPSSQKILAAVSLLSALIILAVAWIGFDQVFHRFASTTELSASGLRAQTLRDLRQVWRQFPIFGTGLGTHAVIFPMFDRSQSAAVSTHAENEYAQTMTETGVIGLTLAIAFIAMIWLNFARAIRGRLSSISAIAIGLGFGFAAILIHSFTDFGQHIPADALLTAVTCGMIVSLARQRRQHHEHAHALGEFRGSIRVRLGVAIVVAIACGMTLFQSQRLWAAEREFNTARGIENRLRRNNWSGTNNDYASLIIHAQKASDIRPGNVEYASWLGVYRWKWISVQPDSTASAPNLSFARRIADELNRARLICPTFGLPASMAGQIELFVLHDPSGADDICTGAELNRNDPTACFVAGQLAASEGKWELSLERLKHYAEISAGGPEVVDLYVNDFARPDLALQAVKGDVRGLEHLAELLTRKGSRSEILANAKRQAEDLRLQMADRADASAGDLILASHIAIDRNDHAAAIAYLRRALATETARWDLRLELASQLASVGSNHEASTELQIILRHDPDSVDAKSLLAQLGKKP